MQSIRYVMLQSKGCEGIMSRIYEQLNTKTLGDVEAIDIQALQDKVHIQEINKQELETYNLINEAAFRNGLPMPNTQKLIQASYNDNGSNDFFIPGNGEVWMLVGGDTLATGGTGTVSFQLKQSDGKVALLFIASVNGQEPIGDNSTGLKYPIYISSTNWLVANVTAVATSVRPTLSFIRVR